MKTELGAGGLGVRLLMDIAFLWTKARWYKVTNIITENNNTNRDNIRDL
ncbi:MAG TPA: hypothetical protein VE643_05830 [Nitrososphaeraceae archaeon]|nr:hypothetical protein [Nitrososphaeraceae archaeon]